MRRRLRELVAVSGATGCLLFSASAFAHPKKVLADGQSVSDAFAFSEVTLPAGATVTVIAPKIADGAVHIIANKIQIDGVLDGSGAGSQGDATGTSMTEGIGGFGTAGEPGGGGAFFGDGGAGTQGTGAACTAFGGLGGTAFATAANFATKVGGAGGAGDVGGTGAPGSAGGARIILEAAEVVINGTITVDGNPSSLAVNGVSAGGGSGGVIEIITMSLTGHGHLQARGGDAKTGSVGSGGGGSGGIIAIHAKARTDTLTLDVSGGASGAGASCALGSGAAGTTVEDTTLPGGATCIDADRDGHPSAFCDKSANADCDDSDPTIFPGNGAKEICDGEDNDCNGKVDDGATCPSKNDECKAGMCVPKPMVDAGGAGGGGGGGGGGTPTDATEPNHVVLTGGCNVTPWGSSGVAFASALLFAAGLLRERRRPKGRR